MKQAAILFAAALVVGCAFSGPHEPDRYFVLGAAPGIGTTAEQLTSRVRVAPTSASSFYDTQDIVYSRTPGTRAYYQFNHWTERPQRIINEQLASRLAPSDPPAAVVLNTHLDEMYHDAVEPPGNARIEITAELVDSGSQSVLARRTFNGFAPATSYDAPGAVEGFRHALGALVDDVVAWVNAEVTPDTK